MSITGCIIGFLLFIAVFNGIIYFVFRKMIRDAKWGDND